MTAFMIAGGITLVAQDGTATISLDTATNTVTGNRNISVLKIDNPDLSTNLAVTYSLTALPPALDLSNAVVVPANGTVFVQVAPANYAGPVYVRNSAGGVDGSYIQPVVLLG
jgi:hypothetical protein